MSASTDSTPETTTSASPSTSPDTATPTGAGGAQAEGSFPVWPLVGFMVVLIGLMAYALSSPAP